MQKVLFCTLLSLLLFSACQKELNYSNTGTNIITGTDTIYLDTVYVAGIRAGIPDTFKLLSYHYDVQNRLALAKWVPFRISSSYSDSGSIAFYYNGPDTLPYKSVSLRTYDLNKSFDTSTVFYFYDNSGRLIKDSTTGTGNSFNRVFYTSDGITTYAYNTGRVSSQGIMKTTSSQYPGIIQTWQEKDTSLINTGGDIAKSSYYIFDPVSSSFRKASEKTITYDNNSIAYRYLNIFNSLKPVFSASSELFPPFNGQRLLNNPVQVSTIHYDNLGNPVSTIVTNSNYQYRSNGMPVNSSHDDPSLPLPGRSIQYYYQYRSF
ncbi:MAG TPA: hypothetical protein PLZ45_05940 [Ferruginibacter sp.]|nr:hypothetical protein [Ferruginibacter sp.]